ncbi:unnamed protein product [Closterium sp. Naga37s-1]|nr:unnamed protein product [Closterium sp. Naga37s-1]
MANVDTQRASALAGAAGIEIYGRNWQADIRHFTALVRGRAVRRAASAYPRVRDVYFPPPNPALPFNPNPGVPPIPLPPHSLAVPLWWNVNRQYHDQAGRRVAETVTWGGETDDAGYSRGATLYDADVTALVADAITSRRLAYDADGVYFVLSDASVAQAGSDNPQEDRFCVAFCGWHFFGSAPGFGTFITAWTGKADLQCPTSCIAADIRSNASLSPTGDPGMDGLVSVFAHELAEAAASPFVSTWFDSDGEENADKCSWTSNPLGLVQSSLPSLVHYPPPSRFAPILTDPSEARYNLVGGQRLQVPHPAQLGPLSASCKLTLPYPPPLTPSTTLETPPADLARLPSTRHHKPSVKEHCARVKAVLAGEADRAGSAGGSGAPCGAMSGSSRHSGHTKPHGPLAAPQCISLRVTYPPSDTPTAPPPHVSPHAPSPTRSHAPDPMPTPSLALHTPIPISSHTTHAVPPPLPLAPSCSSPEPHAHSLMAPLTHQSSFSPMLTWQQCVLTLWQRD